MKIDDIKTQLEKDKKIDHTQLDVESLRISEQAIKYQQMAHDEALRLRFHLHLRFPELLPQT